MIASFKNSIVCDRVIVEHGTNKISLIGIYSGDIIISKLPAKLSLAFYSEYHPSDGGGAEANVELLLGDKQVAKVVVKFENVTLDHPAVFQLPPIEINIEKPATLRLIAKLDDNSEYTLIEKKIIERAALSQAIS